ncbi:MAG TPA: caspase family protein [Thermoanaerobaculia bacterium]|nr:caspase family protein [Thermoanaerobaculia bacterium]
MQIRTRAARALLAGTLILACHDGATPQARPEVITHGPRRALLIGIDDYSGARIRGRGPVAASGRVFPNLRGAVRDVALLREMLIARYGFKSSDIMILKNEAATRAGIERAIDEHLIAPARNGDVVLFYYAGHGSQVTNSASAEADGMDETIVPADAPFGAKDLRDKDLAVLFNRIIDKGASLTIVADSCNSGSLTRALYVDGDVRTVQPDLRDVRDPSEPPAPESRGALVFSAAKDFARAFEIIDEQGQSHGAFTWALLDAMRAANAGEAAADTFLRAQAIMRAEPPYQDPVIGGTPAAQLSPLLRFSPQGTDRRPAVAIESTADDGTVTLHGGWANGLTVGTRLIARDHELAGATIRITKLLGVSRSEGQLLQRTRAVKAGMLFEIQTWAAREGRPLRVWAPGVRDLEPLLAFTRRLRAALKDAEIRWVDDPTRQTPTHVLRWRLGSWELIGPGATSRRLPVNPSAEAVVAMLAPESGLYVWLPASTALVDAVGVGPDTDYDNVRFLTEPQGADYVLAGRLGREGSEYAWIRPGMLKEDEASIPLPVRSDWEAPEPLIDAGIVLQHSILRLHKIVAWQRLESPPGSQSPYALSIDAEDGTIAPSQLTGFKSYRMVLRARTSAGVPIPPRYYYVFGIDSYGKSVLLFPLRGSVENRFPIEPAGVPPAREIVIGPVDIKPPYGLDTYFLISSDESIPNPGVLQWSGIRTRGPRGQTGLEELFSVTGGGTRAAAAVETPPIWSIERTHLRSVAPRQMAGDRP